MSTAARVLEHRFAVITEVRDVDAAVKPTDGRIGTIVGYAAVFNSLSEDLGGMRETIRPGAFAKSLARGDDVRALFDHSSGAVIGRRSAGTLVLAEDDKGLRVEIAVPDTAVGRDLLVSLRRKDLDGMSFGFYTVEDIWHREKDDKGDVTYRRELIELDLIEVSIVTWPAYSATSAEARSMREATAKIMQERVRAMRGTPARRSSLELSKFKTQLLSM